MFECLSGLFTDSKVVTNVNARTPIAGAINIYIHYATSKIEILKTWTDSKPMVDKRIYIDKNQAYMIIKKSSPFLFGGIGSKSKDQFWKSEFFGYFHSISY